MRDILSAIFILSDRYVCARHHERLMSKTAEIRRIEDQHT
jgi:hypothetical protein